MATKQKWYKIVTNDGYPIIGKGKYKLPSAQDRKKKIPGPWMSVKGPLRVCLNGFHVVDECHIRNWTDRASDLWEVEVDGDMISGQDKSVFRKIRFVKFLGKVTNPKGNSLAELFMPNFNKLEADVEEAEWDVNYAKEDLEDTDYHIKDLKEQLADAYKDRNEDLKRVASTKKDLVKAKKKLADAKAKVKAKKKRK